MYPTVEAYLSSIPRFDAIEHTRIESYMELLGENARNIRTDLPRSDRYSDQEMEEVTRNYILSQLEYLVHENIRRTETEAQTASGRVPLIKPLATLARERGPKSE